MKPVYFLGSKYWRKYLADRLSGSSRIRAQATDWSSFKSLFELFMNRGTTAVVVGLGASFTLKRFAIWTMLAAFWLRGFGSNRLVFYWIGSDVLSLKENPYSGVYARLTRVFGVQHICGAPWFVDELKASGISAQSVLFPYDTEPASGFADRLLPLNPFKVCCYLKSSGWTTLEGRRTLRIAAQTPNVQWIVMGMTAEEVPESESVTSNVRFTGWVSSPLSVQAECHALFRLVQHDAFSGVVRDALAMGRIVMYSLPVAGAINISGKTDSKIAAMINDLATPLGYASDDDRHANPFILKSYPEQITDLRRVLEK